VLYSNGGGSFFIPYVIAIVVCIVTVFYSTGISSYLVEIVDEFVNNFGILILIGVQAIIFGWF
jgi:NSS family neurotransmitter:Na+ symporter